MPRPRLTVTLFSLAIFLLAGTGSPLTPSAPPMDPFPSADDVAIEWGVETNFVEDGGRFRSQLTLKNRGETAIPASGWNLHFNFLRPIHPESVQGSLRISRVNGDFYTLAPTEDFAPVPPDRERTITFEASGYAIKEIDAPSGFYLVDTDDPDASPTVVSEVEVAPFTRPEQTKRIPTEPLEVPTPPRRYQANQAVTEIGADSIGRVVPTPASVVPHAGSLSLSSDVTIGYGHGLVSEARHLAKTLEPLLGHRPTIIPHAEDPSIELRRGGVSPPDDRPLRDEAYRFTVDATEGIEIVGASAAGVFYGIKSLQAWLPVDAREATSGLLAVPAVEITDVPRFEYRGFHLDVARNFQSMEAVKRLLDVMALYKLNTFHFHLTDDEGWRLAIDGLPELTEVGGRRGHTLDEHDHLMPSYGSGPDPAPDASSGSGWYTQDEYREILRYAAERHIEVIPEIDVPGHARAAIQAMKARARRLQENGHPAAAQRYRLHDPEDTSTYESIQGWNDNVINVCQPSTYRFLSRVIDEVQSLHQQAGLPLTTLHLGGDEVPEGAWTESPVCTEYIENTAEVEGVEDLGEHFLHRMRNLLSDRGLTMGAWEEVALTHEEDDVRPNPDLVGQNVRPYAWGNVWGNGQEDHTYSLANAGYEVVMSHASNFYFDMAYDKHPAEPGFYWAGFVDTKDPFAFIPFDQYKTPEQNIMGHPVDTSLHAEFEALDEEAQSNILGLQGQLWAETLRSTDRMEYMAIPRIMSLAERAWAPQPDWATIEARSRRHHQRDAAWNEFSNRLGQRELPRLSQFLEDWSYRLPPPGAIIEDGQLHANVALPGLPIRYTTDGSPPTPSSRQYTEPVEVSSDATIRLRTFDSEGRGSRTVTVEP